MATVAKASTFFEQVGNFLATAPSRAQILDFELSDAARERFRELVLRSSEGVLTREEQYEFNQFELIEPLLQYVKARIRAEKKR